MRLNWLRRAMSCPLTAGCDVDDPRTTALRQRIIREKAFLRRIYEEWYQDILEGVGTGTGPVLELGSGAGFLREHLPSLIASDVFVVPGLDLVADATALPFRDASLRAIVMINVLHHVRDVSRFFAEAGRAVRPGGRMVLIEPWSSRWGTFVYRRLHHEPYLPAVRDWSLAPAGPLSGANSALPWVVFARDRGHFEERFPYWHIVSIDGRMPFRYLLSGGVSMRSLAPDASFPVWRWLDHRLQRFDRTWPMFARVVLQRLEDAA